MEEALRREGRKKGYSGKRLDKFVYSIMNAKSKLHPKKHKKSK